MSWRVVELSTKLVQFTYEGRSLFYLFGLRGTKMERISEIL